MPLDYLKTLTAYWQTQYDWRAAEAELNVYPQFTTSIDGQTIHFVHVRSPESRRAPADAHPRLAGLDRRVHGRHRAAQRSRARTAATPPTPSTW